MDEVDEVYKLTISIHSPRVGRDMLTMLPIVTAYISIHSPRVGRDDNTYRIKEDAEKFQSTLPVWGETYNASIIIPGFTDFNPLSPCGERLQYHPQGGRLRKYFNPLSPCGERPVNYGFL